MSNEPSSDPGVTPVPDLPVTGTPTPAGVTPQESQLSLEAAMKRIAELEHSHKNAVEERDRHRKKLSGYEKAEQDAKDAQLSEIERVNKQYTDLQAQHTSYAQAMQERVVRYEVERQAAKLGIIDPDAAARLLDASELEYGDDGIPTNAEKLLEKLVKSKPYLAPKQEVADPAQTPPARGNTPVIPAMNPGRSSIAAPGSIPPGRIPRLSDPGVLVPPGTVSKYQP